MPLLDPILQRQGLTKSSFIYHPLHELIHTALKHAILHCNEATIEVERETGRQVGSVSKGQRSGFFGVADASSAAPACHA